MRYLGHVIGAVLLLFGLPLGLMAQQPAGPAGPQIGEIDFSGEFFLAYVYGEENDIETSEFFINRAYLTAKSDVSEWLFGRITFDTNQDGEGDGEGDMEVRLKYAYGELKLPSFFLLNRNRISFGIVHGPWLSFEEHVTRYRLREQMFLERSGVFNSADFGVTWSGLLGPKLNSGAEKWLGSSYLGRYGSFALGLYNGGGYHAQERNLNKVLEGRLTLRPLPESLPGLQLSLFGVTGEGNVAGFSDETPDWKLFSTMISLKSHSFTLSVQMVTGKGNQGGRWVDASDTTQALAYQGGSFSGEVKLSKHWRLIGGVDRFDRDEPSKTGRYTRGFAGIGYDVGGGNLVLLDYDVREFDDSSIQPGSRVQLAMRLVL